MQSCTQIQRLNDGCKSMNVSMDSGWKLLLKHVKTTSEAVMCLVLKKHIYDGTFSLEIFGLFYFSCSH